MPDDASTVLARRIDVSETDATETFHGFLLTRSPRGVSRRRRGIPGHFDAWGASMARLTAAVATFSGGGLVGSGLTLIGNGRQSLGPAGFLVVAGLTLSLAAVWFPPRAPG